MEFVGEKAIPVIDICALLSGNHEGLSEAIKQIENATQRVGFFYISNHGVSLELQTRLETLSRQFFSLPVEEKRKIDMSKGGKAWRGYFGVGDELTSGIPDQKEGIYFGSEDPEEHHLPLHGPNLWPSELGTDFKETVLQYMDEMKKLGW
jgi:isopenicillin N synthase-like dioxygenase